MATKLLVTDVIEVRSKPNITVKQDGSSDVMSPQYEMSEVHNRNLVDDDSGTHLDNSSTEGNSQKKYALDDKNLLSPRVNTEEKRFISIPSPIDDNMDDAPEDMSPGLRTIADMKSFRDIATTMKNLERDLGMESINQEVKDEPNRLHFFVAEQGTSSQNTNQKTSRETSPISEDTYRKKRPSILKITDKKSDMKRSETTTTEKRSISSGAKKHWTKLSNVFRSLTLMKSLEVKNIGNSVR